MHKAHIRRILEKKDMNQIQIIIILLFSNNLQAYHKICISLFVLNFVISALDWIRISSHPISPFIEESHPSRWTAITLIHLWLRNALIQDYIVMIQRFIFYHKSYIYSFYSAFFCFNWSLRENSLYFIFVNFLRIEISEM